MKERLEKLAKYYGEENRVKNLEEKFDNLDDSLKDFIECCREWFENSERIDCYKDNYTEELASFLVALGQFIVCDFVDIDKLKEYFNDNLYWEYITIFPILTSKEKEFLKKEISKTEDNIDYIVREYDDKKFYLHIIFKDKQDKKIEISNDDYNGLRCTIHYNLKKLGL